jgi:twitching motility two-component system response regulator PilH
MSRKILIVDDAESDRVYLQHIIRDAGHFPLTADCGTLAIERARDEQPDLILMDINMPGMDGFAVTRRLRADDSTKDIPIVFVSGMDQDSYKTCAKLLGARAYLVKPYSADQIRAQIDGLTTDSAGETPSTANHAGCYVSSRLSSEARSSCSGF